MKLVVLIEVNITKIFDTLVQRLTAFAKRLLLLWRIFEAEGPNNIFHLYEKKLNNRIRYDKPEFEKGLLSQFIGTYVQYSDDGMW